MGETPQAPSFWEGVKAASSALAPEEYRAASAAKKKFGKGITVGDLAREQVANIPDDPSRWFLNTVMDLGIVSADAIQGLTKPENVALITLMATGNEGAALPMLAKIGFGAEMGEQAIRDVAKGVQEAKKGNLREAGRLFGSASVNALMIALASRKPKGPSYRVLSEGKAAEVPEAPARLQLEKKAGTEIQNHSVPKAPEASAEMLQRRDALQKELAATKDPARAKTLTRQIEGANRQLESASVEGKAAEPVPSAPWGKLTEYPEQVSAAGPVTKRPIAEAPEIIIHPKPLRAEGKAITATPDDVRLYVKAKLGIEPAKIKTPSGEVVDLAEDSRESDRIRDQKITKPLHDELFPEGKFRPGLTVGQAVDDKLARKPAKVETPPPPPNPEKIEAKPPAVPERPVPEAGWKLSLGKYSKALAEKERQAHIKAGEEAKLVADPRDPKKYWISYKPKASEALSKTSLVMSPKAPKKELPDIPGFGLKQASWESRGDYLTRRLKSIHSSLVGLIDAGPMTPEQEADFERLEAERLPIYEEWQKTPVEAPKEAEPVRP